MPSTTKGRLFNSDCFLAVSAGQCNFWPRSPQLDKSCLFFSRPPYNLIKVPAWSIITIVSILSVYTNNKALSHFLFSLSDFPHLRDGSVALCCHGGELQTVIFQVLELWYVREVFSAVFYSLLYVVLSSALSSCVSIVFLCCVKSLRMYSMNNWAYLAKIFASLYVFQF